MRQAVVIIIIIILALSFASCTTEHISNVVSIDIDNNSFKDLYDVDEQLDLTKATVTATYKSGDKVTVPCTSTMIVGFDTATTGEKSMYITYNKVKSSLWEYRVVNKGNETRSITTSSRIKVSSSELPNAASYAFSITAIDLEKISAINFTVTSTSEIGANIDKSNIEITNLPNGWKAAPERIDAYTLKLLVYKTSGMDIDSDLSFATLNIIEQNIVPITVSGITVSDGVQDYYLPNIK